MSSDYKEKRRDPRTLIRLPVDFWINGEPNAGLGLVINASEAGLRIQAFNDIPISERISIEVSFPKGTEFKSFRAEAEIIWKDVYLWDGWEEYQYGLKFVAILNEDHLKLRLLLCGRSNLEEASFRINNSGVSV
jgi:hypothetical protein